MKLVTVSLFISMLIANSFMVVVLAGRNHGRQESPSVLKTGLNYLPRHYFKSKTKVKAGENKTFGYSRAPIMPKRPTCLTCSRTGLKEEEIKQMAIDNFVEKFAEKLRTTPEKLRSHPKMKAQIFPPEINQEILDKNKEIENDFYLGKVKAVISSNDLGKENCYSKRGSKCYSFDIEGEVKGRVQYAELWVPKMAGVKDETTHTYVVYGLEKSKTNNKYKSRYQLHRVKKTVHDGWVTIDVTSTVSNWVSQGKTSGLIAVRCETCLTDLKLKSSNYEQKEFQPLMYVIYHPSRRLSRRRRFSVSDRPSCNTNTSCCKQSLRIRLSDLNMYQVITPDELDIGVCTGTCENINGGQYARNNTQLAQIAAEATMLEVSPCCVPVSHRPFLMHYRSDEGNTVELMSDLIVNECGCL